MEEERKRERGTLLSQSERVQCFSAAKSSVTCSAVGNFPTWLSRESQIRSAARLHPIKVPKRREVCTINLLAGDLSNINP